MFNNLTIPQEFVILALDSETNKLNNIFRQHIEIYTVMASLVELSLKDQVEFKDDDTVIIKDATSTGDKSLDRLLEIMISEKPKKVKDWVYYFSTHMFKQREIYKLVVDSLLEKGILKIKNSKVLFVVPKKTYVDITNTRNYIVEKIRAELLEEGQMEERTIALVLFLNMQNILVNYFSNFEHITLKQKIKKICEEEMFISIKSIDKVIQNMDATLAATSAVSASISST